MRLYEFTDPKDYTLADPDVSDLLKQAERTLPVGTADIPSDRLKEEPKAKKIKLLDTL